MPGERAADEQRDEHDRRRQPQHAAVDARHQDAALELLVQHHQTPTTISVIVVPCGVTAMTTGALAT